MTTLVRWLLWRTASVRPSTRFRGRPVVFAHRIQLQLEPLENRVMPAGNYRWIGGNAAGPTNGSLNANWQGLDPVTGEWVSNDSRPSDADDTAIFDNAGTNFDCQLDPALADLWRLRIDFEYSKTVSVNHDLQIHERLDVNNGTLDTQGHLITLDRGNVAVPPNEPGEFLWRGGIIVGCAESGVSEPSE